MATAPAPAQAAAAPPKSKKKLIIIIAAVAVLLLGGGGAAVFMMKKNAADAAAAAAESEGGEAAAHAPAKAAAKHDPKSAPVFVPLDPFTVNLADRDAERYAQIGITLEIEDAHLSDQIKTMMPAIRNNILLAIADRTAGELMGREGKSKLAERVRRETSRALGADVEDEETIAAEEAEAATKPARKAKKRAAALPVKAVHFSNFIIQ
ncbi:Flagellar biosynthesis protein fliL [Rubrivivax sp. A210]|uniref:flagellar basal body-associated FliL family protein n=1 Tax=Rubrivivax sp. A210 TaxID=2772301 RepID=UPI001917E714|nr:flagellar basal body-associated FliL family protein [Rubrivivax sp. A210]CAD5373616.1 Flagellar biosynthesis protein fliL [Rubrivivax sp. A210]